MTLAPAPEILHDERFNPFTLNPEPMQGNTITSLFVTTRTPSGDGSAPFFQGKEGEALQIGYARLQIGEEDLDHFELIDESVPVSGNGASSGRSWTPPCSVPCLVRKARPTRHRCLIRSRTCWSS